MVADSDVLLRPRRRTLPEIIEAEARRLRRRRLVWVALSVVFCSVAVITWLWLRPKPIPVTARFRAQTVTLGDIVREVHATGHVEAVTTVSVGAEISGRLASVEVDYNDRVQAGQVLARFDRSALAAQRAQAKATLAAARASLAQSKIDQEQSERDAARARQLNQERLVSDADNEAAIAKARLAAERVEAAQSQVLAQQAAYALAGTNLDHSVIRSPIDGIVITRNVDSGQTVASMLQTPVLFSVAADLRQMQVVAAVDEADIGEVQPGQAAAFTVNAFASRDFLGKVTEVRNSPVIVQDVVTYGCVIAVDNTDLALKPGMTASVRIRTASRARVLRIASSALHFAPPGESASDGKSIWTLQGETLKRVVVAPGIGDGELTEIAKGPLNVGDKVLVELTAAGRKAYGIGL